MTRRTSLVAVALAASLSLLGCQQKMAKEGKLQTYAPDRFLPNASTSLEPVEGTVARGELSDPPRPALSAALLRRGRERYQIYCAPCHNDTGYGDGMIVQRGFLAPPSYHTDRLRQVPDEHIFDVITHGYGAMYSYGDRVEPTDRWAIVAYIRALQLSQNAPVSQLAPDDRRKLESSKQEDAK